MNQSKVEREKHINYGQTTRSILLFKCINSQENIWSARVTRGIRAVGVMDDNTVTWFWIGNHDDYERFFS